MSHFAITIACPQELTDILIAQLSTLGFEGFEEQPAALIAYIPEEDFDETSLKEVLQPHALTYAAERIAQQNWNAVWESNFEPVLVDDFCGIRAGFHPPFITALTHEIIITPKMSFGTGHHATTSSMIRLMSELDFRGKKVFDFGTGTGILAILAEKMGAAHIDAIDNDEWAVENTQENIVINEAAHISIWRADSLSEIEGTYDLILANINRNILLTFMADMRRLLHPGGILLLSGILTTDEATILEAAGKQGLEMTGKAEKDNWLALKLIAR
ncbi:50S ribosomal protein L11 methyltransferase [Chitinophaga pendula]|uniref:50S ribosomal protein L11 methyltransferase n=1 Tax=Chitinophaga TaxID=79328 RepID=UPI0012FE74E5|nr:MULTISPECIES: 50S ribosomal protein L11 methyltransferase [Chitinophaga]UCJ08044.1 50S ribosomal protein L11 methyltransferase [Chitinophaga pendula]